MHTTLKLLTSILTKYIANHLDDNNMIVEKQKENISETRGMKNHLLTDKTINKDTKQREPNQSMCWIDWKKAFNSTPHSRMIETLKNHNMNES